MQPPPNRPSLFHMEHVTPISARYHTYAAGDRYLIMRARIFEALGRIARTVSEVEDAATSCAVFLPDESRGCDGCDRMLDPEVLDAAPAELDIPGWAVSYDANGDPDVVICPFCALEARDDDHLDFDPMGDDEWEAIRAEEELALDSLAPHGSARP